MIYKTSYLKNILSVIGTCAVPAAVFTLTSCGGGKWKTIRRSSKHPCRNIQGIPVRTTDTGRAFFRGLDGTSRSMADGQGFRVRTYPTGHAVAFPHRYAQRVPLAARFHPYGTFPAGTVETAHL